MSRPYFLIHESTESGTAFPKPPEKPCDMQTWLNRKKPTLRQEIISIIKGDERTEQPINYGIIVIGPLVALVVLMVAL